MGFCNQCGTHLDDKDKFCPECGTKVPTTADFSGNERSSANNNEPRGQQYHCDNCGASLPSFNASCPFCGYEVRAGQYSNAVKEFAKKLTEIDEKYTRERSQSRLWGGRVNRNVESAKNLAKAELIKAFPIPNTKEDILEFFILAKNNIPYDVYEDSKSESEKAVADAWVSKCSQTVDKARIVLKNTYELQNVEQMYSEMTGKVKRAKRTIWRQLGLVYGGLVGFIVFVFLIVGITNSVKNTREEKRLRRLEKEISQIIDNKEYELALQYIELMEYNGKKDTSRKEWEIKSDHLIKTILEKAEADGQKLEYIKPVESRIKAPDSAYSYEDKQNYRDVVIQFENAGFTNITTEGIGDLKRTSDSKLNVTKEVSINGDTSFYSTDLFDPSAVVIIRYHSLAE